MEEVEEYFWNDFIEIYREYPELWQIKSEKYKNRQLKNSAYLVLLKKLHEKYPKASVDTVKKKINSFRTAYRRELKKVRSSERSGSSLDAVYEPNFRHFFQLDFLRDQEEQLSGVSSIILEDENFDPDTELDTRPHKKPSEPSSKSIMKQRNELLSKACSLLDNEKSIQDDASSHGVSWAVLFRKLDPGQQMFANKLINDVMYQGALGRLSERTQLLETLQPRKIPRIHTQNLSSTSNTRSYAMATSTPLQSPVAILPANMRLYRSQPEENFTHSPIENDPQYDYNTQIQYTPPPESIDHQSNRYHQSNIYSSAKELFDDPEYC